MSKKLRNLRKKRISEPCMDVGGRCKGNLYLTRHKVRKDGSRGYRCKNCDKTLSEIRYENERRKR